MGVVSVSCEQIGPRKLTVISRWPSYSWMGKLLMGLFLVISHFMIM